MSQIIADSYEILQQIGSGGGGVVYLGRHLRLGKLVVLKADRRDLTARPEVLRREVDALKNLSHTYIPQVYDFVAENGVVYTVMDYIEGESLDKPLKRGERFSQAQVIKWACQLLEALCYLHSRPPHGILHSDIKPSNLMLTPQGDIRLIDFNIALALGEEGAVRVGFSRGYASPEHYGIDYSGLGATQGVRDEAATRLEEDPATVVSTGAGSSSTGRRTVLLDVRSDIYSAGATLYHLFTGRRPAQDAKEVETISSREVSPAVAAIVRKAMEPDPDKRWQTAAEMLRAFEHLHENDPRTRRRKRRMAATAGLLTLCFLAGGGMTFVGLKQMERTQNALALAGYSADALERGDVTGAIQYALQALPQKRGLLDPDDTPQAQRALAKALGVYDLTDGYRASRSIPLASEPLKATLSPEGTRAAAVLQGKVCVYDPQTGAQLAELEAENSALSDALFLDEDTLIYAGPGALTCYSLAEDRVLWSGQPATAIARSADGSTVAAVYKEESRAVVYAADGSQRAVVDFNGRQQAVTVNDGFADPEDALLALNGDGSLLAVSFADGGLELFDTTGGDGDIQLFDGSDYTHFEGGFYGKYFAFAATDGGDSVCAVIDTAAGEQTGAFADQTPFHVQADESGIYVSQDNVLVGLDPETGAQTELAYTEKDIDAFVHGADGSVVATEDGVRVFNNQAVEMGRSDDGDRGDFLALAGGRTLAASRDVPALRLMEREEHPALVTYDPAFAHDEARLSADGKTVMLFRYDAFRLCRADGSVLADVTIPEAQQVYDQQFRRENGDSWLEVVYNDGLVRRYSAADGSLMGEEQGPVPSGDQYEEFFTDRFKITSPLHGTPEVYDRETGKLVTQLEPDAYLTYVTQVGDYIITEYISAQGDRYGLLLDGNCQVLADLPRLCDITPEGKLVFDDKMGTLRESRIYSLQELLGLAENSLKEEIK